MTSSIAQLGSHGSPGPHTRLDRPSVDDDRSLSARAAVSLDELNERASLLTRVDRKYVLTPAAADAFIAALPAAARVLEIDGRRAFRYTSTYFDTPALDAFLATARRRPRRGKVRSRIYLDSGLAFLEVKTRHRGATVKTRIPWSGDRIDPDAAGFVTGTLAEGGVQLDGPLEPTLRVDYLRSTILLPDAGRVTIDSGLTYRRPGRDAAWSVEGLVIIETKSASQASSADRLLWRLGHRPAGLSKYATGLAALRPELPRNRWHRLLQAPPFRAAA
jgi:hypothetical protein